MRDTCRALLVLLLSALVADSARPDDLTTAAGKKFTGTLVAVDAQGVTFKTAEAEVKFAAKDVGVVELGPLPAPPPADARYTEIELHDGSVIRCVKYAIKGKKVEFDSLPGPDGVAAPTVELPTAAVFSVMRSAEDAKVREKWRQLLQSRGKRDLYVQRQADGYSVIQGTIIEGTADGDKLVFDREDGTRVELRQRSATGGLVLNSPQPATAPTTQCKVLDAFGNTWSARAVEQAGAGLKVTTVAGVVVSFPARTGVARLDYSRGNVAYLSDLIAEVTLPELPEDEKLRKPYLKDKGIADEPLKLDTLTFAKGIWANAHYDEVALAYTLSGDYREFKAVVGCPETVTKAPQNAAVTLVVEADGRVLATEQFKLGDKPKDLTLDVKGTKTLKLTVRPATPYQCTQLILGDARVQK